MLYNKNNVRKANDKKVLHKVGKSWKVVSVALLMAIGGTAVATHANANADANNGVNAATSAEVQALEQKPGVVSSVASASTSSSASAKPTKPASAMSYLPGYNGSAASYHAKALNDNSVYNHNITTVNHYVNSINAKYPNQTNSLNNNYNSAAAKANADQAAAQSYSALAAQPNHSSQVSSLASKAGLTYSGYVQSVSYSASSYAAAVSNGASVVSEMNVVNSYAQLISDIDNNSALENDYRAKYDAAEDASEVDSAYAANADTVYNSLIADSSANDTNLANAIEKSAANSAAEQIAHINSGLDATTTNNLASSLGFKNNSSETSSDTSYFASSAGNVNGTYAYKRANGGLSNELASANNGRSDSSVAANNLYVLLSDTATMQAYGSTAASANSVIASAVAAKPSYSNAIASASAVLQSYNNASADIASSVAIDSILADGPTLANLFEVLGTRGAARPATGNQVTLNSVAGQLANGGNVTSNVVSTLAPYLGNNEAQIINTALNAYNVKDSINNAADAVNKINANLANLKQSNNVSRDVARFMQSDQGMAAALSAAIIKSLELNGEPQRTAARDFSNNNDASALNEVSTAFNNLVHLDQPAKNSYVPVPANGGYYVKSAGLLNPNSYASAAAIVNGATTAASVSALTNSVANSYNNERSASASYSAATDENVTLAGIYATSYSDDVASDENVESAAKNSLDDFYLDHADAKYANASVAASSAASAEPNDAALAHANGVHVYNYAPKYITVTTDGQLHSDTDYASNNVIAKVPAGTIFEVLGVGFAANGTTRYVVNYRGKDGYFTASDSYVEPTYLQAANNVSVTLNKDVRVYKSAAFNGKTYTGKTLPAGTTLPNVNIVSEDGVYGGFTRVVTPSGLVFTSNTDYVSVDGATSGNSSVVNNNNNINNNVNNSNNNGNNNGINFWD